MKHLYSNTKEVDDCLVILECFRYGIFNICGENTIIKNQVMKIYSYLAKTQGYKIFFYTSRDLHPFYNINETNKANNEKIILWLNSTTNLLNKDSLILIDDFNATQYISNELELFILEFHRKYPKTKIIISSIFSYKENKEINYLYLPNRENYFLNVSLSNHSIERIYNHKHWNPDLIEMLYNILMASGKTNNIVYNDCILDSYGNPISIKDDTIIKVSEINEQLLYTLSKEPNLLYSLTPYEFERVIAKIFEKKGFSVKLTSQTHDGGKDIFVAKNDLCSFLFFVECKKYAPNDHVGIDVIQRLYGVVSAEKATGGIIATTSYFTKPAKDYVQEHKLNHQISLHDYNVITNILKNI